MKRRAEQAVNGSAPPAKTLEASMAMSGGTAVGYGNLVSRSADAPPETLTRRIQNVNEKSERLGRLLIEIRSRIVAGESGMPGTAVPSPPEPEHALFAAESATRRLEAAESIANEILRLL